MIAGGQTMKDLTFGEQVKIILSRKGMTIKELAELIQEETGKAMSRQNLTQRLGRDNFQEQDMRMIAKILGCPFRLSIFPTNNEEDFSFDEEALLDYIKKSGKKKKEKEEQDEDVYQQEFVFDEMMTASVAEMSEVSDFEEEPEMSEVSELEEEPVMEAAVETLNEASVEETPEEFVEDAEEEFTEEDTEEITENPIEESVEEIIEEIEAESVEEIIEELKEESVEEIVEEPKEESAEEATEEIKAESEEVPEHKQERFRGGLFFKFGRNKKNKKTDKKVNKVYEEKSEVEEIKLDVQKDVEPEKSEVEVEELDIKEDALEEDVLEVEASEVEPSEVEAKAPEMEEKVLDEEDAEVVAAPKEAPLPSQSFMKELEKFEPIVKPQDDNEDLQRGELNPYTGHEYQTNSVRMHPSKIGYVQVYDRTKHGWIDMTEWAFLGYQEKKKKQLGRNYEPPIYLD